jgi:hypothetical protein
MSKVLFHIRWIIVTSFLVAFVVGVRLMQNALTKACSGGHGGLGLNLPCCGRPEKPFTAKRAGGEI